MYYALVAFCSALLFVGVLRRAAPHFGLVDSPTVRKTHLGNIPLVGGLAVGASFLTVSFMVDSPSAPLIAGCLVILATGLFDDLKEFSARSKFIGQFVAAGIMTSWGHLFVIDLGNLFGFGIIELGYFAVPFTLFCIIGLINAMNMIDGLDGVAGGTALIAGGWFCMASGMGTTGDHGCFLYLVNAALVAFLIFNLRHPWRKQAAVFLGDAGSMFLGFVLVWAAVATTQSPKGDFYAISAVWILGVPIMDTVYLMSRRMIRGMSPFAPDRRHFHHTLTYIGLSETKTSWVLLGISLLFGAIGFGGWYLHVPEYLLTYSFLVVFAAYCVFMQCWRSILPIFGIKVKRFGGQAAGKPVTVVEGP